MDPFEDEIDPVKGKKKKRTHSKRKSRSSSRPSAGTSSRPSTSAVKSRPSIATAPKSKTTRALPPPSWAIDFDELTFGKRLGKGGFGEVYAGMFRDNPVAIKRLLMGRNSDPKALEEFRKEIDVLSSVHSPNIVLFMGACLDPDNMCIVTELVPRGSLFGILHDYSIKLRSATKLKMAIDVARGMSFLHLHRPPIMHRDLKTLNLLVTDSDAIKICDFGMTTVKTRAYATTVAGTTQWMAPEILREGKYNEKADVFSFGIVLWELLTRQPPYFGMDPMTVKQKVILENYRPAIPPATHPVYEKLVRECWDADPSKRPTFSECVSRLESLLNAYGSQ